MRCKNCGCQNDDNRYICENCGSPLYDENDYNEQTTVDNENEIPNLDVIPKIENNDKSSISPNKDAEKKSIIVISILAVILIAIIASVIVVAQTRARSEEKTSESTTISTTDENKTAFSKNTTKNTTTTTEPKTTTTTTTTTVTTTTTTTTQAAKYQIKLISEGGGRVSGGGNFTDGDNVTISAVADDGYVFEGWYSNGAKISSTPQYSFTAVKDITISAIFSAVDTDDEIFSGDVDYIDGGWD